MEYTKLKTSAIAFVACATILFAGCKKEETVEEEPPVVTSGMVVGCEGTFGMNNASLQWIGDDGSNRPTAFATANGVSPGDVLQNYTEFDGRGYVVMNNSQKVEVIKASDFSYLATISGLDYPRDILVVNAQKAYVTNGSGAGDVKIIDLASTSVTGSIAVGNGPESIACNGDFIFVANSGGFGFDNTVSVIDPLTDAVVATVEVGDLPTSLEVDYQGNVWALCKGYTEYDGDWNIINETAAEIVRIDGQSHVVTGILQIGEVGDHPKYMDLTPSGTSIYIVNDDVKVLSISTGEFGADFASGSFHAIGVNDDTGEVYLSSSPDYVNNDEVYIYSSTGELKETYESGIAPHSFTYIP